LLIDVPGGYGLGFPDWQSCEEFRLGFFIEPPSLGNSPRKRSFPKEKKSRKKIASIFRLRYQLGKCEELPDGPTEAQIVRPWRSKPMAQIDWSVKGKIVEVISCSDPYSPLPSGLQGTAQFIDAAGTLHGERRVPQT
jgi:hypothetical protein